MGNKLLGLVAGISMAVFLAGPYSQSWAQNLEIKIPPINSPSGNLAWFPWHPASSLMGRLVQTKIPRIFLAENSNAEFVLLYKRWAMENGDVINKEIESLSEMQQQAMKLNPNPNDWSLSNEEKAQLEIVTSFVERVEKNRAEVGAAIKEFSEAIMKEMSRRQLEDKKRYSACQKSWSKVCEIPFGSSLDVAREISISPKLRALLSVRLKLVSDLAQPADEPLVAKIVDINVTDTAYIETLRKAERDLWNASFEYNVARDAEKSTRSRFRRTWQENTTKIKAINKDREKAQKELRILRRAAFSPNFENTDAKNSARYKSTQAQIERIEKEIQRWSRRIEQVKFSGGERSAPLDIKILTDNIAKAEARISTLETELRDMSRPKPRSSSNQFETEKMRDIRTRIEASARQRRKADIALDVVADTLFRDVEKLNEKDQKYANALQALGNLKGKEAKPLLRINTNYTFVAAFTNRFAEMKDLNRAIRISRQAVRDADFEREIARRTMLDADVETSMASENLEQAIMDSASSQLALEAYMQAKEGIDASKAGPGVFLLWGANRLAQNIFNPPKVYEPEYRLDGEQSVSLQILESYFVKDKQEAAARASKYGSSKAYEHLLSASTNTLKLGQIENEMQKILGQRTSTSSTKSLASLLTKFKAQEALYDSGAKALSARMYGSGKAKLAASVSFDLIKSLGKSIGVEAIKRQLADFFEGDAWRRYMRAQQRFVLSVKVFGSFGNIYWENRDTLDGLVSLRRAIKSKYYDEKSKLQIEVSEKFDVKEGLRFWFLFADKNGEPSSKPHPGNISVFLDDAPLIRKPNSNIFDLTKSGAKALRKQGDKELTLRVVFK